MKNYNENENFEVIKNFFDQLSEKISSCFGFEVNFPMESTKKRVIIGVEATHSLGLAPDFYSPLTLNLFKNLREITNTYINDYGYFSNLINNIINDLALSLIFDDYKVLNHGYDKFENLINELKEIGARSYEGKSVDIGVIYCPNSAAKTQVEQLKDADYIRLPITKTVKDFFNEEKPFLRLIDNMSVVIVIDNNFNVMGILRKKDSKKSLNYLLEQEFNTYLKHNLHILATNYFFKLMILTLNETHEEHFQEDIEKLKNRIDELQKNNIEMLNKKAIRSPKFTYFSIQSNRMKIFTKNEFVLTYSNGDWKLKHYNFVRSLIADYLKTRAHDKLISSLVNNKPERIVRKLDSVIENTDKLVEKLLRLSQSNVSSIILIDSYEGKTLKDLQTNLILKNNADTVEPIYLNVIKNKNKNLNIKNIDYYLFESIASVDGAVILDSQLNIVSFGEVINTNSKTYEDTFGTGTTAARYASQYSLALKISEDGDIFIFEDEELKLKL
ncbi:hypothetical protein [Bacillus atrophaeus]|uniref:hypothetical protein n=1 Tax=Bacillus atrophaeus TaxID=1452 RepID=UPI00227DB593|nr:hypothetical protein [Bacillus atrophaeus]MCY8986129.1 hypothetical protein [Bacillus atrophaeus]MDL5143641.1 hypothetical protein [Bacillus atrophaeus]